MSESFEIKHSFVDKWVRFARPEYLQIYIYLLSCYRRDGSVLTENEIIDRLHVKAEKVQAALDFWITAEVMYETEGGYGFCEESDEAAPKKRGAKKSASRFRTRPSYSSAEIDAAAGSNKSIDYLFKQAEKILDRLLSPSDFEMIYSFVDWLGLPVEVVTMLLSFAASQGKTSKRYIETVAIDWADRGINTYESAEEYMQEIELRMSNEGKIRGILGIYDRALTQTEKKYIKAWTMEKNIAPELVEEAYDRTVAATGKLSWAYMNKILISWDDEKIRDKKQLEEYEMLYKMKNGTVRERSEVKKSKFNNYTDTNKPDYSNFADKILQDMLDES